MRRELHGQLQFPGVVPGSLQKRPLFGERVGQLENLDGVEWLLENQHPLGVPEFLHHFLPGVVGISRANYDLQVGISFPEPERSLQPIPSGRHAHVGKNHRVAAALPEPSLHEFERLRALRGKAHVEVTPHPRGWSRAEYGRRFFGELQGTLIPGQYFPEVVMNCRVIVDDEDPAIRVACCSGAASRLRRIWEVCYFHADLLSRRSLRRNFESEGCAGAWPL